MTLTERKLGIMNNTQDVLEHFKKHANLVLQEIHYFDEQDAPKTGLYCPFCMRAFLPEEPFVHESYCIIEEFKNLEIALRKVGALE